MSKNMTRKGLAFGAGFALVASGLAAMPAQAAGIDNDSVSLLPFAGDEYDIIAGADFKLKANMASGIVSSGQDLKFQVTDSLAETSVVNTQSSQHTDTPATFEQASGTDLVTVDMGEAHEFDEGDEIAVNVTTAVGTRGSVTFDDGARAAGKQQGTIVVDAAGAENDTVDIAVNGETVTATVPATPSTATVADSIKTALDGLSGAGNVVSVSVNSSTVTVEADSAGVSFTLTEETDASNLVTVTEASQANVTEQNTILVENNFIAGDVVPVTGLAAERSHTVTRGQTAIQIASSLATAIGADTQVTAANGGTATVTITATATQGQINPSVSVTSVDISEIDSTRATITDVTGDELTYKGGDVANTVVEFNATPTVSLLSSTPDDGVYIFDTKDDTNSSDKTLTLSSTKKDVTQTVEVIAWVDSNDNGKIDSTEYQSPARTVRFLASSAITPTAVWNPISVGDSTVSATVTFSPTLNGAQLDAAFQENDIDDAGEVVRGEFERPGSAEVEINDIGDTTYSDTTKTWTITSINMNDAKWQIEDAVAQGAAGTNKVAIKDDVVTLTTTVEHKLRVGDIVNVASSSNTDVNNAAAEVLSVPSATSFTYAVTEANEGATDAAEGADAAVTVAVTTGDTKILRDFAVAGEYKLQVQLFRYHATLANQLTDIGSKFSSEVGATVASSATTVPTFSGVATASVNAAGKIKTGTNAANFVLSVFDKDGDPVGAGVDATITTTTVTSAGTVTIGGTKVVTGSSFVGTTDANGQIAIALNNTSGAASEEVKMDADVQNVSATTFTATWEDAVYTLYNTADQRTSSFARNVAVNEGESYTFDLKVVDQWNAPIDNSTHRLRVESNQDQDIERVVNLDANGEATVVVADAGEGGSTTVEAEFQKLVSGVYVRQSGADDYVDWDGAADNDLAPVVINYYDQTDKTTLNADGASLPSGTAAELDANVTTTALTAVDTRFTSASAETYTAAETATIGGKVTNANTGIAKSGAVVTLSAPGVLFNAGGIWSLDSIDVLSDNGTFSVDAFSRVAGDIEVTVTHGAVSEDVTVDFSAVGTVDGYSVELTAPASVDKGKTFRVQGAIKDVNGNGVPLLTAGTGTNPTLTVTYQGLGLVSGSLPTTTDANGNFYFYVLVGSNDEGTATITASYDIDGTATKNDSVATSQTVYIGQAAPSDQKVNAGSFKGYVAVYALGYEGQRLSAKIGNDWVIVDPIVNNESDNLFRVTDFTGAGVDIQVRIYIDRVLVDTIPLVTK